MFSMSVRDHVRKHLSAEDAEKFALWAFGSGYSELSSMGLLDRWNRRHGDWMTFDRSGKMAEDVEDMVRIYVLSEKGNSE